MIPMFHCALFRSSPLILTTCPTVTSDSFLLWFKLCLSLNDVRYSLLHLSQAASLHFWIYFWHFHRSLSSIFSGSLFGIISYWPKTSEFSVKTGNSMSSSMQAKALLFKVASISVKTSANSCHSNFDLPTVFYNAFFTRPIILSNCPPHQGALLKLNFYLIPLVFRN